MHVYPIDFKDKNGKLFWSLPKRPPTAFIFDLDNELCFDFVKNYTILLARVSGLKLKEELLKEDFNIVLQKFTVPEFKLKESDLK